MAQWALLADGNFASDDCQIGVLSPQEFVEYVNDLEFLAGGYPTHIAGDGTWHCKCGVDVLTHYPNCLRCGAEPPRA